MQPLQPKLYATTKSISLYLCSIYFFLKLCNVYYEMFDNCLRTATASTEEKQSQVWKCSLSNEIYETKLGDLTAINIEKGFNQ